MVQRRWAKEWLVEKVVLQVEQDAYQRAVENWWSFLEEGVPDLETERETHSFQRGTKRKRDRSSSSRGIDHGVGKPATWLYGEMCQPSVQHNPKLKSLEDDDTMVCRPTEEPKPSQDQQPSVGELCQTQMITKPYLDEQCIAMEMEVEMCQALKVSNSSQVESLHTHQLKPDPRTDVEMCQAQRQPMNSKVPKPDKPKVEKVRRWTRLKSGLFGWKTVNVVEGLPKPSCNKNTNNQTPANTPNNSAVESKAKTSTLFQNYTQGVQLKSESFRKNNDLQNGNCEVNGLGTENLAKIYG